MKSDTPKRFVPPDAIRYSNKRIDDVVALERPLVDSSVAIQAGNQTYGGKNDTSYRSLTFRH